MKDLEWLKKEVKNHIEPYDEEDWLSYSAGGTDVAKIILELIDQVEQPELPEIPGYVAEYIENEQESEVTLEETLKNMKNIDYQSVDIVVKTSDYFDENPVDFIDAYRYGYTVEEKKYRVAVDHENGDWTYASDGRRSFKTTDKTKAETLAEILGGRVIAEEVTK